MEEKKNLYIAYIYLHIAVLAYGFTAILGALISISPMALVWWRLVLTISSLLLVFRPKISRLRQYRAYVPMMILTGVIISMHWVAFYTSIKLANASVAVVVLATMPVFTSILAPMYNRTRFDFRQLITGILVIPGMALIFNNTDISMQAGVWVGILAAFLSSLYTVLSKNIVDNVPVRTLTHIQLTSGLVVLTCLLPLFKSLGWLDDFMPVGDDWMYLIILSIFCTTMAFMLTAHALRSLTPFIVNLTINLEPVYGVILAIVILKEHKELNFGFYLGMGIILGAVFLYPVLMRKQNKSNIKTWTLKQ